MNTKHTLGPWGAVTDMYGTLVIRAPAPTCSWDYHLIATIQKGDHAKANAVLIAAALRTKTALEDLLMAVNDSLVKAESKVIAAMQEARAAIKEAAK